VIQRFIDIQLAFPGILLTLVIISVMGPGLQNVMIAIGFSSIPSYTRLARASVLSAKTLDYVTAARAMGCSDARILFMHLLPNIIAPIIIVATLGLAFAILNISSLSFIGLGAQPPTPEWGAMAAEGRNFMRNAWWLSTLPGIAIMMAVLAINLMGDGLRDALDPRMKSD
jgi:ABC-type dipeptide/oligopeptide/nickel transport system permease subunit